MRNLRQHQRVQLRSSDDPSIRRRKAPDYMNLQTRKHLYARQERSKPKLSKRQHFYGQSTTNTSNSVWNQHSIKCPEESGQIGKTLMTDTCAGWVDAAQVLSGIAATVALGFNAYAIQSQNKATASAALHQLQERSERYDARLHEALGTEDFRRRFVEFVNFLEILATSINKALYPKVARKAATNQLLESLSLLQTTPGAAELMTELIDSPNTFNDVRAFIRQNNNAFKDACERRLALAKVRPCTG